MTVTLLFNSAPATNRLIAYFFLALFASLAGIGFFSLYGFNYFRFRSTPPWQATLSAGRLAVLIATYLTLALLLRSYRLWNIATGIVLVVILVVVDLIWRGRLKLMRKSK